jgi:hypothetical protein
MRNENTPFKNPEILGNLYWKDRVSLPKIARNFDVSHQTILYWMNKNKIPRRSCLEEVSKVKTKYSKFNFSGNLIEKAYMLGLRTGDLYVRTSFRLLRISVSTTHLAQIQMIKEVFEKYTHVCEYNHRNKIGKKVTQVYCNLNKSFSFLIEKPIEIPKWILENNEFFYSFLAGYIDAEGCFEIIKNGKNAVSFRFSVVTTDEFILKQIKSGLEKNNLKPYFSLKRRKGFKSSYGKYNKNLYGVGLRRKSDTIDLVHKILPFSQHSEKIRKMKLILNNKDKTWDEIENKVLKLRNEIKLEHL